MNVVIDVKIIIRCLFKKWWIFVCVGVLSVIFGLFYTSNVKPNVYEARVSLYSFSMGSYAKSVEGTRIMQDYADIARSYKISNQAKMFLDTSLTSSQIQSMVNITYEIGSSIFYITSQSSKSEEAINVANAVAQAFVYELRNMMGEDNIQILDQAAKATKIYDGASEQRRMIITIPVVAEFLAVVGLILYTIYSKRIKSVYEASLNGEIVILGVLPKL